MTELLMIRLAVTVASGAKLLASEGSLVPSLLTGGGFVFLAAIMTGLFMVNKNSADGAAALAKGSTELTEGVRQEIKEIKADRDDVREKCRACEAKLDQVNQHLSNRDVATYELLEVLDLVVTPLLDPEPRRILRNATDKMRRTMHEH